jgi:hypothetical protein
VIAVDLQNTALTEFPIELVNCDYSCLFTFPNELQTFVQSRQEADFSSERWDALEENARISTFVVSPAVTRLSEEAFSGLKINNLVLREGVTTVGANAFKGVDLLKAITLPASVTTLEANAFACNGDVGSKIETVDFRKGSTLTEIGDEAFKLATKLQKITLPKGLEIIGAAAFQGVGTNFVDIDLPETLKTIGDYAFKDTGLLSIEFPASVETVGAHAFEGVGSIEIVEFPFESHLISIGEAAFQGCTGLKLVQLPPSIQHVYADAFKNASSIQEFGIPTSDNFDIVTGAITGGGIQVVQIICTENSTAKILAALEKLRVAYPNITNSSNAEKLIVSFDPALLKRLSTQELVTFATDILHFKPVDDALLAAISTALGVFEIDASNTDLRPEQFPLNAELEVLPWAIFFPKLK